MDDQESDLVEQARHMLSDTSIEQRLEAAIIEAKNNPKLREQLERELAKTRRHRAKIRKAVK